MLKAIFKLQFSISLHFKKYYNEMRTYVILVCLIVGITTAGTGQIERKKNSVFRVDRTELGVGLGTSFYFGDFNEYTPFVQPGYYGSILHRYSFNMLYSLRTSILFGNVAGNSARYVGDMPFYDLKYAYARPKIYFSRNFIELNSGIEMNFLPFEPAIHRLNQRFTPYLFLGIGIMIAYSDRYAKQEDARSASSQYPKIYGTNDDNSSTLQIFNIPIGLGLKISPWERWTIGVEWLLRKTFNDDVDRFNNIRPSDINNNEKGSILLNTDWVSTVGVSLSFRLAVKSKCPTLKRVTPSTRSYKGINTTYNLYDNGEKHAKKKNEMKKNK
jgi:opacity protein-like surface antigen